MYPWVQIPLSAPDVRVLAIRAETLFCFEYSIVRVIGRINREFQSFFTLKIVHNVSIDVERHICSRMSDELLTYVDIYTALSATRNVGVP